MKSKPRVIAIVGPTASGKTALGIWLAKHIQKGSCGAEIISADSRQVYKGLDIGTGKVTKKEMAGVPHHLLDIASPKRQLSADDFVKKGTLAIAKIVRNHHIPIVVGGTGYYADTLLGRMTLPQVPPNPTLRTKLEKKSAEELFALLKKKDPRRAATIEPHHKRRLVRALEIAAALGKNLSKAEAMRGVSQTKQPYEVLWLGLNPSQATLQKKISNRLHARMKLGMIREAKQLHAKGLSYKRMEELGLEYRSMARLLQNRRAPSASKSAEGALLQELERAIFNYAKRQNRWFKRNPSIVWIKNPPASRAGKTETLQLAKKFLAQ
jgi:tRNA dimethylallyltransferase